MAESCGECVAAICECLLVSVWSVVSLALGLVFGVVVGIEMTVMVFLLTLLRTPLHILKNLYVAATTKSCFTPCQYFDPFLRILVLLLVPVPHLLWLVGITLCSLTIGTLYYIGKATKTIFKGRFSKQWTQTWTNIRLEKGSKLGEYLDLLVSFTQDDSASEDIVFLLKGITSFLPGVPLGALPFIPFTIAVVCITLYRLPINVYKTVRIAIKTVTLKWDLKLLAILLLPIIHTVFPLVVFGTALIGSFFFFAVATSISIAEGNSPFEEWGQFKAALEDYYKAHEQFVGDKYLGKYDHPTGIPSGWRGQTYGLPIHRILQWQWDFLVCCVLLLLGLPVCFAGSAVIFAVKLIPGTLSWWSKLCSQLEGSSLTEILGCWAFWFCGFLFTPVAAVLAASFATILGTLMGFGIPYEYLTYGCWGGLYAPLEVLREVDSWDFFCLGGCCVLVCLPDEKPHNDQQTTRDDPSSRRRRDHKEDKKARQQFANAYWDRFASQCIQTTADVLENGWICLEDVQGMDPAVLQAVPAIALLTILSDSVNDPEATTAQHITWSIDGTHCTAVEKDQLDNIAALLWPKVMNVKQVLQSGRRKKALAKETNLEILAAILCSTSDEPSTALEAFLKDHEEDPKSRAANSRIRSKLTELSLMMLRVRPFQDRMESIFCYNYVDKEKGATATEENNRENAVEPEHKEAPSAWQTITAMWRALGDESTTPAKSAKDSTENFKNTTECLALLRW